MFSFAPLAALPLAADIQALVEVVVILIAVIGWVLGQVNAVVKKVQQAGPQPPMPQPDEQIEEAAVPAKPRETKLTDEIEQFLREAAERRAGRPPAETSPARRPGGKKTAGNRGRRNREPLTQNALDPATPPQAPEKPQVRETVANSVQSHLDTHQFADRAAHLTSVKSEQKIDAHLHQAFDHELGKLAGMTLESRGTTAGVTDKAAIVATTSQMSEAAAPATVGSSLAILLSDPSNLKNAVILNEILQRPTDRWE